MKNVLLFIWQLPQNLLALILILLSKRKEKRLVIFDDKSSGYIWFVDTVFGCGVSLGNYILLDYDYYGKLYDLHTMRFIQTKNHEHGHQKQSLRFGMFYLMIIGLPSVFNNLIDRFFHYGWSEEKRINWYYNRFPEKQADVLGGVER